MKKWFLLLLTALFASLATMPAHAQVFFSNARVGNVVTKHTTVGTSAAVAVASADVLGGLLAWKICNDAVNTSTYLYVGKATDPADDGVQLGKGQCLECPNCSAGTLKLMRVKAQAASNGYSVVQYKQQ